MTSQPDVATTTAIRALTPRQYSIFYAARRVQAPHREAVRMATEPLDPPPRSWEVGCPAWLMITGVD